MDDKATPAEVRLTESLGPLPRAWIGLSGQTMPHEIYVAWAQQYPNDAKHFEPLYEQDAQVLRAIADLRRQSAEIARLRGLVSELAELADNWPGIAYTEDLARRVREVLKA